VNGGLLAEELEGEVARANEEWKQIDRELLRNAGLSGAGLLTAAPLIGSGQGTFLAAAVALAGAATLGSAAWQRRGFPDKFPAAFFLRL
jgi:hypothetical protein